MALSSLSLFNYGLQVTILNQNLDFKVASMGPQLTATIPLGFYSVTGLAAAVALAMQSVDANNTYTTAVDRTIMGGTQNRMTISTSGTFLTLLFGTGTNLPTSISSVIGFNQSDYAGSTSYAGSQSVGTALMPIFFGYNYLDNLNMAKVFGAVNVSASGLKEAVVFQIQKFINVEYMHEPKANLQAWQTMFYWLIQQRPFDFTPEIANPTNTFQVTLESTEYDNQGLGFQLKEELPNFPNLYGTGSMTFRIIDANQAVITGA